MDWVRSLIRATLFATVFVSMHGWQTTLAADLTCGEACSGPADQDPLIIFIGADRDVGKWGKLPQVAQQFRNCGYNAVYFDPWKQLYDDELLAKWIRHAVKCRGRRVMLVGWSWGAIVGLKALEHVAPEGIRVDTFIEIDCFNLNFHMRGCTQPSNADRVGGYPVETEPPIKKLPLSSGTQTG